MSLLDRLESRFGRYALRHIPLGLIFGQILIWLMTRMQPELVEAVPLVGALVLAGEWWRVITFMFFPATFNPLFLAIALWFFYFVSTSLENTWGVFKFNVFLLVGWASTVAVSLIFPGALMSNAFIGTSIFLAFALLYPEFVIMIWFVLPMKMRWLGWITWAGLAIAFVTGDWADRVIVLATLVNLFLFFGPRLWRRAYDAGRGAAWKAKVQQAGTIAHKCIACGRTDQSHPELGFSYCSRCAGAPCYCEEHVRDHVHLT